MVLCWSLSFGMQLFLLFIFTCKCTLNSGTPVSSVTIYCKSPSILLDRNLNSCILLYISAFTSSMDLLKFNKGIDIWRYWSRRYSVQSTSKLILSKDGWIRIPRGGIHEGLASNKFAKFGWNTELNAVNDLRVMARLPHVIGWFHQFTMWLINFACFMK